MHPSGGAADTRGLQRSAGSDNKPTMPEEYARTLQKLSTSSEPFVDESMRSGAGVSLELKSILQMDARNASDDSISCTCHDVTN
ncbi:putative N-acetyltransferase [Anopheles sinensis]|uniref:Putative N-acetyltransferase n=1 Tax=Anopheles sinensis TaxID=74873 RepID=A0A084WCG8_ANOSI|nr:putative N-acetyltransferase [Anopheles sinensis]